MCLVCMRVAYIYIYCVPSIGTVEQNEYRNSIELIGNSGGRGEGIEKKTVDDGKKVKPKGKQFSRRVNCFRWTGSIKTHEPFKPVTHPSTRLQARTYVKTHAAFLYVYTHTHTHTSRPDCCNNNTVPRLRTARSSRSPPNPYTRSPSSSLFKPDRRAYQTATAVTVVALPNRRTR